MGGTWVGHCTDANKLTWSISAYLYTVTRQRHTTWAYLRVILHGHTGIQGLAGSHAQ